MHFLHKCIVLILLCFPMYCLEGLAQDYDDLKSFQEDASARLLIHQGRLPVKYQMLYNGVPYWDLDGFLRGDLFFNGKLYRDVLMEIDACQQELITRASEGIASVSLGRDDVSWFTRGGSRYVNLPEQGYDLPEGFYQELYEGAYDLYKRVNKSLVSDIYSANGAAIGYVDPRYRTNVYDYFGIKTLWYVISPEGEIYVLKKPRDIFKVFTHERKAVKKHMKNLFVDSRKQQMSEFCIEALKYSESL